jgi:ubiquinone/menaquinone biosynthesis C-methylase UbiE
MGIKHFNWNEVWERKGALQTYNLKELDGFEHTAIDPEDVASKIISMMDIRDTDKVLEVGCGAGMIAQYLDCDYVGVDYSQSSVEKHSKLLHHTVQVAEADKLPFKDEVFDKVLVYSVFHYFPDKKYAHTVLTELERVCKGDIFVGDLPFRSPREEHLLYNADDFDGEISEGFYNKNRFNVLIRNKKVTV